MSNVNHTYKNAFIHVPKNAGTSMERKPFVGGAGHQTVVQLRIPDGYWIWGFVRNPFARLVSFHSAVWQYPNPYYRKHTPIDFEDFVLRLTESPLHIHLRPQAYFFCFGKVHIDFIGRFESLMRDWATVCEKLNVAYSPLPRRNATRHKPWQSLYTKRKMVDIVAAYYAEDFEQFEYPKEINHASI